MTDQPLDHQDHDSRPAPFTPDPVAWDDADDLGEDEVPTIVLYVVAGLLLISFTLYLVVGGGHSQFH
jgi:hypothetical protein